MVFEGLNIIQKSKKSHLHGIPFVALGGLLCFLGHIDLLGELDGTVHLSTGALTGRFRSPLERTPQNTHARNTSDCDVDVLLGCTL